MAAALQKAPSSSPSSTQVAPLGLAYLARLVELGLFEGPRGEFSLSPAVAPLVDALHQVLAGGEVLVKVTVPGHAPVVEGLQRQLACANVEANALSLLDDGDGFTP